MTAKLPSSILFCCDYNAVRSPMAEGIMKKFYGDRVYIQSAGIAQDMEIDGFVIAVCNEIGIELARHRTRVMNDAGMLGDNLASFDTIVALSPRAHDLARQSATINALTIEYWPTSDPTAGEGSRSERLDRYRRTRDELIRWILDHYGSENSCEGTANPAAGN